MFLLLSSNLVNRTISTLIKCCNNQIVVRALWNVMRNDLRMCQYLKKSIDAFKRKDYVTTLLNSFCRA